MGNDKSPGLDGIPVEFYKTFWPQIGEVLVKSFNESHDGGELSNTQKQAVLSLIFKKGDSTLLKNYRPISLTNTDYRTLTFCLSLRLQKVIDKIVSLDQSAYIKSRFIGTNARLIEDMIEYCNRFNKVGLILFLDFEKAFDTVEWSFIFDTLEKFGFGISFINWIKTLYKDASCFVKNNGFISEAIRLGRGIRQGCAISALIFILIVEILALRLKANNSVKGIKINLHNNSVIEQLLTQYADEMSLFLESENCIKPAINTIKKFSSVAGPTLNLEKTEGLWLGSLKTRQLHCQLYDINWPVKPIRALGIYVGHSKIECHNLNWENKLLKIESQINNWSSRKLTLMGKIYLIKSEFLSKIIYSATILPIPDGYIKKLNKILFKFLWPGSEKIKRVILQNDFEHGGLKMINITTQFYALKAAWIPRLLKDQNLQSSWTIIPKMYFQEFGDHLAILKMNCYDIKSFPQLTKLPKFYQEVIIGFNKSKIVPKIENRNDCLNSIIWGNRNFNYNQNGVKKVLISKNWHSNGFIFVKNFRFINNKVDQRFILDRITDKSNILAEMTCFIKSVKPYLPLIGNYNPYTNHYWSDISITNDFAALNNFESKKSKFFYGSIQSQNVTYPYTENHWRNIYPTLLNSSFPMIYLTRVQHIKDYKLAQFNYKFYHRILPTEKNLKRWKIQESDKCIHCNIESDEIHMLFTCEKISTLWITLQNLNFFKVEARNANAAYSVYFSDSNSNSTIIAATLLCYAIFVENMERKNNSSIKSASMSNNYIKNFLKKKLQIYKHLGWHPIITKINKILENAF